MINSTILKFEQLVLCPFGIVGSWIQLYQLFERFDGFFRVAEILVGNSELTVGFAADMSLDFWHTSGADELDERVAIIAQRLPNSARQLISWPVLALNVERGRPHHIDVRILRFQLYG